MGGIIRFLRTAIDQFDPRRRRIALQHLPELSQLYRFIEAHQHSPTGGAVGGQVGPWQTIEEKQRNQQHRGCEHGEGHARQHQPRPRKRFCRTRRPGSHAVAAAGRCSGRRLARHKGFFGRVIGLQQCQRTGSDHAQRQQQQAVGERIVEDRSDDQFQQTENR